MKIPILTNFLRLRARKRLRVMMRGYRLLRNSGQLDKIANIKEVLTKTPINGCKGRVSIYLFGAAIEDSELVIRQYLLLRVGGLSLNKSLLYYFGSENSNLTHPLPAQWQAELERHGIIVATRRSSLMWNSYVLLLVIRGIITVFKHIYDNSVTVAKLKPSVTLDRYAYFSTLTKGNLPIKKSGGKSYDLFTWYYDKIGYSNNIETLCHSVNGVCLGVTPDVSIVYLPLPVPALSTYRGLTHFLLWSINAICLSCFDLLRGRWWNAFILHEAVMAARVRIQSSDKLARDYMFHNSNWFYRPLWTYEAESKGSRILFYFYSANVEQLRKPNGKKGIGYGWQAANWPNYLVWDQYQASFIRDEVDKQATITEVGPIWFNASDIEIEPFPLGTVAIFDVQPIRDSFFQTLGADTEYYTPNTANQFLLDVYDVLTKSNYKLALKRKRNLGKLLHPKYQKLITEMTSFPELINVDPDVSALEVIESCCAVISMPFTSTALLARVLGKPSIYYDPLGFIQKNEADAHGIVLISGKEELEKWLVNQKIEMYNNIEGGGYGI